MSVSEAPRVKSVVCHELALKVYIDALLNESPLESVPKQEKTIDVVPPVSELVAREIKIIPKPVEVSDQRERVEDFEVLMFQVAGSLTLATPLAKLNGIQHWSEDLKLHPMPGYADWLLGVLATDTGQVKVIDIAKLVIPANHKARASLEAPRTFKHIVIIGEGEYGLACDELGDVIKLTEDSVRWRKDRQLRPWLAGTVIEQMCALLDVDAFTEILKQ